MANYFVSSIYNSKNNALMAMALLSERGRGFYAAFLGEQWGDPNDEFNKSKIANLSDCPISFNSGNYNYESVVSKLDKWMAFEPEEEIYFIVNNEMDYQGIMHVLSTETLLSKRIYKIINPLNLIGMYGGMSATDIVNYARNNYNAVEEIGPLKLTKFIKPNGWCNPDP